HQSKTHQTNVAHSTTEANFPRINPSAQQKMDATRRKILQKELTRQKDALAQAKKAYKAAASIRLGSEHNYQKYLDRVKPYKNAVKIDEQNVHAIEQELYKLRNTGYLAQ
ncbi:MAG: hypothetical protein KGL58_01925, partial [Pseudomonadota bacterium]|nr:hypothetical protein [Pseudomonadota bacterium]